MYGVNVIGTRKNIKKTLKLGLELEEIGVEGLEEYKRIIKDNLG